MQVRWLELSAFRNYTSLSFIPDPGLNVLIGRNGQGKTSLLEAVHLLLAGRSFRTMRLTECVAFSASGARVAGEVAHGLESRPVRLALSLEGGLAVGGGLCPWARVVTFTASDLGLLTGQPQGRRIYLDGAATKVSPAHGERCRRYRLVLHQRGRLLGRLAGRADADRLLAPWDAQVAELGSEIVHRRLETLAALGPEVDAVWGDLARDVRRVELVYEPAVEPGPDRAGTQGRLAAALTAGRRAEIQRGATLVGPHRDDLEIRLGGADARRFASRGEQRLVVLTLRLAEAAAVRARMGAAPVLLLDDVLSDLDLETRARVGARLRGEGQVLVSMAEGGPPIGNGAAVWDVRGGSVVSNLTAATTVAGQREPVEPVEPVEDVA